MGYIDILRFVLKVASGVDEDAAAAMVAEVFDALIAAVRAGVVTKDVTEYSCMLALGVVTSNPTMDPRAIVDLVSEGVRLLILNPDVSRGDSALDVAILTSVALAQAGFVLPKEV
jgi:hypothetical protein